MSPSSTRTTWSRATAYVVAGATAALAFVGMVWMPALRPIIPCELVLLTVLWTLRGGRGPGLVLAFGSAIAVVAPRWYVDPNSITAQTDLLLAGLCALILFGWLLATLERARTERNARLLETLRDELSSARASTSGGAGAGQTGARGTAESELRQISHDLVQPLAAISNYAELIRGSSTGEVQAYAREVAGLSAKTAKHIREILSARRLRPEGTALDATARGEAHDINVEGPE